MNTPSVKTLMTRLNIEKPEAQSIKTLMANSRTPYKTLVKIDKILENCGVEYVPSNDDDGCGNCYGLEYSNTGEMYHCTVVYDYGRGRWYCCTVADIIERDYKRFG